MDNSNSPNSPNNSFPSASTGSVNPSLNTAPQSPFPTPQADPAIASTSSWPSFPQTPSSKPEPSIPSASSWATPDLNPAQPASTFPEPANPTVSTSPWATSTAPEPTPASSSSWPATNPIPDLTTTPSPEPNPTTSRPTNPQSSFSWTPPVQPAAPAETTTFGSIPTAPETFPPSQPLAPEPATPNQPAPTFTPPAVSETNQPSTNPNPSPLDNPWNASVQSPTIDGTESTQPQPIQPSWSNIVAPVENPTQAPPTPAEAAPTDLSHLIGNNHNTMETPNQPNPETLIIPPTSQDVSVLPIENHKGIPGWLIGLGIGLIIIVGAASAYFILGVGQPAKTTTSLPVTVTTNEATPTAAPAAIQATAQPTASGSASFEQLQGGTTSTATTAADLLRQRQQTGE